MAQAIIGTLPMAHGVDPTGSFTITVPLQLPESRLKPVMSLAYHSAAIGVSALGIGWALKGISIIERVPATMIQDKFRGSVSYNIQDRFALDGRRLIKIAETENKTEYRFEIEDYSKVYAFGPESCDPTHWEHHLPDGTIQVLGKTQNSNIKGLGITATRVWAICELTDPWTNYLTFTYHNEDTTTGAFYPDKITYGGNHNLNLSHQREVTFIYENRPDPVTKYFGGQKIQTTKRMTGIISKVQKQVVHQYKLAFDNSPLTNLSRIKEITLANKDGDCVSPLKFQWYNGNPNVFEGIRKVANISPEGAEVQLIPQDVNANGTSDLVIMSKKYDPALGTDGLYLDVFFANYKGELSNTPAEGSGFTGLLYSNMVLPLDTDGNGKTDLLHISSLGTYYKLTVLLSTPKGYQKQKTTDFFPTGMDGKFRSGDFQVLK
ncbi:hypothetical protein M413DRAFT_28006 [Hebeloma cylindrosporum]|uniref:Insecticide toxin TcdB middle/N-terminal domain-containing protein n=1 Tax=Hebeloma cylindrosporum TaxID=76867 RepID=A0A0C3CB94_HEBCY|nr:hypothetical protein M413DRAFT_28006 [Hebeloma cylindrosporum h7]